MVVGGLVVLLCSVLLSSRSAFAAVAFFQVFPAQVKIAGQIEINGPVPAAVVAPPDDRDTSIGRDRDEIRMRYRHRAPVWQPQPEWLKRFRVKLIFQSFGGHLKQAP